jgi:molybdopterin-guanine dinucleotide biosynthesis protein A
VTAPIGLRVLGAVLVGGASSRFGSDKAQARWGNAPLADHAAAALAPFVAGTVRVGGADGLPDLPRPGLGPLGGVAAALRHGQREGFDSVVTIACDMPRVPTALLAALLRHSPACCTAAPVLGHWPVSLADGLIARLVQSAPDAGASPRLHGDGGEQHGPRQRRTGALSVRRWAADVGAMPVAAPGPLANVNTPDDLLAL